MHKALGALALKPWDHRPGLTIWLMMLSNRLCQPYALLWGTEQVLQHVYAAIKESVWMHHQDVSTAANGQQSSASVSVLLGPSSSPCSV